MRKKIVAGNWKMNTSILEGVMLADGLIKEKKKKKYTGLVCRMFCRTFVACLDI
jgi:triosephosphate isomerase